MEEMNIILSLDNYSIYNNDNYYLCMPKLDSNFYHVFMGFSDKDLTNLSKDELIKEIRKISDSINAVYKNGIYVLPIIEPKTLKEATTENDDRSYNKILNNIIRPITFEVYKILTTKNLRISQTIKMIKQNDIDKKLIHWISLKLGSNFIKEITFENNQKTNPKQVYMDTITHNTSSIFLNYNIEDTNKEKSDEYISDSLKPAFSPGFGSLGFIIMILSIFTVFGIAIAYMIIK